MSVFRHLIFCLILFIVPTSFFTAEAAEDRTALVSKTQFYDSAGRSITVEKPFARIISLYPAHTENLFSLGLDKEIIGISRSDDYPAAASGKKSYSSHDGPEKFLAGKPDLVLVRPMIDRGYAPLIERLEQFGVVVVSLQPSNVDQMFEYWKILGVLTGKSERAEKMIEEFEGRLAKIRSLVGQIDHNKRKKVYFEAIHSRMKTFSPGAMPVFALKEGGGINLADDADSVRNTNIAYFGKERILSLADQIEVYLAQRGAMNDATVEMIRNEPGFSVIKAVRNGNVYLIDEKLVSRPTMRLLEGITEIGRILHPEVFTEAAVSEILSGLASTAANPLAVTVCSVGSDGFNRWKAPTAEAATANGLIPEWLMRVETRQMIGRNE